MPASNWTAQVVNHARPRLPLLPRAVRRRPGPSPLVWASARGDRQVTSDAYAFNPTFSIDDKKLYYLVRTSLGGGIAYGALWVLDLESDQRQRLLPDFQMEHFTVARDGNHVVCRPARAARSVGRERRPQEPLVFEILGRAKQVAPKAPPANLISRPVTNFRFNQSLADLLQNVEMLGRPTRVAASESSSVGPPIVVPALTVRGFFLSSVSDAI